MEDKLTPMMRQYRQTKSEIPDDALLLYHLGDFYEVFFEDASRASKILGLTLTKRAGVPMAGFPHHALDAHLPVLLSAGVKVALAEQMEDPKLAKGLVKRAVTRIITPGTVMDNAVLEPSRNNFLTALVWRDGRWALALLDISTGAFESAEFTSMEKLQTEFTRLGTRECLIPESFAVKEEEQQTLLPCLRSEILWTRLDDYRFDFAEAEERLKKHFHVATLDGFGCRDFPLSVRAAGALLYYAGENLRQDVSYVGKFTIRKNEDFLELDSISQRNLELVEPLFGTDRSCTLLSVLDECVTPMGRRLLRNWILRPLRSHDKIVARLDAVENLVLDPLTLTELRETASVIRDLERITARLNIGSANARDLLALATGLEVLPGIRAMMEEFQAPLLHELREKIGEFQELSARIRAAITDDPPLTLNDGGLIREGFSPDLDELRKASTEGKSWLAAMQSREAERTGIKSLKIKYNQVFGYYIEISKSNLSMVPEDYIRKQTLVNAERFMTPELKELESKILGSEEKARALEFRIFQQIRSFALEQTGDIQRSAEAIGELDVLADLAEVARRRHYVRPVITESDRIDIRGGRHPILDARLGEGRFVPNDLLLDCGSNRMMILTGPNMAGKSTYIRQTALLVILAQMGSFVPAQSAEVGLADRIFTRVGASDDLARGQSTFMVEMIETANILNHATNRSLVILDEIGRGTSTFDGLSLAWAVAEFLHDDPDCRCRTLFATHYHELTELAQTRRGINNFNVAVREYGDQVIFLRQIVPGSTDRSYGIHVARLAGLPNAVIDRAQEILKTLEENSAAPSEIARRVKIRSTRARNRGEDDSELFQMRLF